MSFFDATAEKIAAAGHGGEGVRLRAEADSDDFRKVKMGFNSLYCEMSPVINDGVAGNPESGFALAKST